MEWNIGEDISIIGDINEPQVLRSDNSWISFRVVEKAPQVDQMPVKRLCPVAVKRAVLCHSY